MAEKDSEREAFEADYLRRFNKPGNLGRNPDGTYGHSITQARWDAWKARSNLTQPAQAVDVGAIASTVEGWRVHEAGGFGLVAHHPVWGEWRCDTRDKSATQWALIATLRDVIAALPNSNGKEG